MTPFRPVELFPPESVVRGGSGEGIGELFGRCLACSQVVGSQQQEEASVGVGHDCWEPWAEDVADTIWLVVAVIGVEWDREPRPTFLPVAAFANAAVGDVAQSAVGPSEAGTDPVGDFASQGALGVVDADEAADSGGGCVVDHVWASRVARRHTGGRGRTANRRPPSAASTGRRLVAVMQPQRHAGGRRAPLPVPRCG